MTTPVESPPSLVSSPPLSGERVTFTGTLASMTHRQAAQVVAEQGGTATEHVSKLTTMLVIGEEGWPLEEDGKPSVKLQQARKWCESGVEIRLVRESDWLEFVGLREHREQVHRHYTPAMLSQLLRVPVGVIRGWERLGLIHPVQRIYRLPYFDFQEVSSARRLAELIQAGVSRDDIRDSLHKLCDVLPNIERPLAQLDILAGDHELLYRDAAGKLKTVGGQQLFDFDALETAPQSDAFPSFKRADEGNAILSFPLVEGVASRDARTPEQCVAEGGRLAELGELDRALVLFRQAVAAQPTKAEWQFHLAEALYRQQNTLGALERYWMAVELDPLYVEAWTQLGCVAVEAGELATAEAAFRAALEIHPDYPDAHYHRAEVLHQLGRTAEAVDHWRRYLHYDSRGPWAALARERLDRTDSGDLIENGDRGASGDRTENGE